MAGIEQSGAPHPKVIVHQAVSLDGKTEGFEADIGLFYLLAQHWPVDIHLVGSETILASPADEEQGEAEESTSQTTLAIVDSQGRVHSWPALRKAPFWNNYLALCSESTPHSYFEYLKSQSVTSWTSPGDKVDLKAAVRMFAEEYSARAVLLDSGGTLSTILFDLNLVDELSLLVHPVLVGNESARSFYRPSPDHEHIFDRLKLSLMETLPGNKLWLRYTVTAPEDAHREDT